MRNVNLFLKILSLIIFFMVEKNVSERLSELLENIFEESILKNYKKKNSEIKEINSENEFPNSGETNNEREN